ncbi:MscL family protein [Candidatus Woesearchaeota archaeon]|nr:MscL family protein [Candidatus Woesearchaeota archaeon]
MVKKYVIEFREFLGKYAIIGMAIGIIMGTATNSLVKSLVDDVIMAFIRPLISAGRWEEALLYIGPIEIQIGHFLSAVLNFLILALIVFLVAKMVFREEEVKKR